MKIRFEAEFEEAIQFEVTLPSNIKEYAENYLVIMNHVREYPNDFYKAENNAGNDVYVTCPMDSAEAVKDFLGWYGEITEERKVLVCRPEYISTRETDRYIDSFFENPKKAPFDIVTLAPYLYE